MATQTLQRLQPASGPCADLVLNSLDQSIDADDRDFALTLLPGLYKSVSQERSDEILHVAARLLNDLSQQGSVRLAAGNALADIGSPTSLEAMRRALQSDEDDTMRSSFQQDLDILRKKEER